MKRVLAIVLAIVGSITTSVAQQVKEKDVPAGIIATAKSKGGNRSITMWVYDSRDKKYVASIFEGKIQVIEVSTDNKWLATTTAMQEKDFPANIMKTLNDQFVSKGFELSNFAFIEEPSTSFYVVEVDSEDEGFDLRISKAGEIIRKEAK